MHNMMLQQGIREPRESYPAATIAYADYFSVYVRLLTDAPKTGFDATAVTKACCGTGGGAYNVDVDRMCGAPGTTVCATPDEYISWDGVHLTQHAYRVMSELLYNRGLPVMLHLRTKFLTERYALTKRADVEPAWITSRPGRKKICYEN